MAALTPGLMARPATPRILQVTFDREVWPLGFGVCGLETLFY